MESNKCLCGCGGDVFGAEYVSGHDLIHRNKLIDRAGGVYMLTGLMDSIESYVAGGIDEGELAKIIRRLQAQK